MALKVSKSLEIPTSELRFSYSRSGGPGGQKVNKSNTKATLKWNLLESGVLNGWQRSRLSTQLGNKLTQDGELIIHSDRYRERGKNIADCIDKLLTMLRQALVTRKRRVTTKPTKSSVAKRLSQKKRRADVKSQRKKIDY